MGYPEYIVETKSREELRDLAYAMREALGLKDALWFPIVETLDVLADVIAGFSYEIVEDDALPTGVHADTDIRTGHIRIKESVYNGACDGQGRDRMTIAHELGHYLTLCWCGFKLQRNFNNEYVIAPNDPEWQAKCFAGELLVPHHLTKGMDRYDIAVECGVSLEAAEVQIRNR